MGKLIVLEGTDGSGKSTQFRLMAQRLTDEKVDLPEPSVPSNTMSLPIFRVGLLSGHKMLLYNITYIFPFVHHWTGLEF